MPLAFNAIPRMLIASLPNPSAIRNIGIIAHIDAGKTTLTERFIFHAGLTKRVGSVDHGNTVMDFLPQERARGITIQAACITIPWLKHAVNIIDTPGHVDFKIEVERAVRVMDGAVAIIDGSAGVQAQTVGVWSQADRFDVKRILFVNKLDKVGADYSMAVKDVEARLKCKALCLHKPIHAQSGELISIHDLINNQLCSFRGENGDEIIRVPCSDNVSRDVFLEKIAELDDDFCASYLEDQNQPVENIKNAIRRIVRERKAVPVLAGSAFKNVAVQSVLDAIIDYLPEPRIHASCQVTALAFKVIADEQRGGLVVFIRVYSGTISSKTVLFNLNNGKKERVTKIMQAAGKDLVDVESAGPGQIAVILGCKSTATGHTLSNASECKPLEGLVIPPPVFQMACSLYSQTDEEKVESALRIMSLEDPSLQVEKDSSTGQLIVSGMGELHLEIAGQRLRDDFKCPEVQMGKVRIAFKETLLESVKGELQFEKKLNESRLSGLVSLVLEPLSLLEGQYIDTSVIVEIASDALKLPKHQSAQEYTQAVKEGIELGLSNGPIRGGKVIGVKIVVKKVHWIDSDSSPTGIRHCVMTLLQQMLTPKFFQMVEPFMHLSIQCHIQHLGTILPDLHAVRRACVYSYGPSSTDCHDFQSIEAEAPLSELLSYVTWLRTATSGTASMSMSLAGHKLV